MFQAIQALLASREAEIIPACTLAIVRSVAHQKLMVEENNIKLGAVLTHQTKSFRLSYAYVLVVVDSVGPRPVETPAHGYKFPVRIPLCSLTSGISAKGRKNM
jgi:hypothetical protein